MYRDMEQWTEIRRRVLVEGVSRRQILRETGMHWQTLKKVLEQSQPPGYRQVQRRRKTKLGDHSGADRTDPEGGPGAAAQAAAHGQANLGTAAGGGFHRRLHGGEGRGAGSGPTEPGGARAAGAPARGGAGGFRPRAGQGGRAAAQGGVHRDGAALQRRVVGDGVERECTETFLEGHVRAFEFFGGVPRRITYDNTKVSVSQILGRTRRLTQGFLQLKSHYLFDHHFCRVARGNEKGVVEAQVKFTRLNLFVPVPQVRDFEQLNAHLSQLCPEDRERRLRGQTGTKAELLVEDQQAFLPLPASPFDACRKVLTRASSLSLVRLDGNDYSVPVRWAHHAIVAKGCCD